MANCVKIEERLRMVKKIGKRQNPVRYVERETGEIIDCDEVEISIFPPPREHGKPHCHVTSKIALKVNGKEVYPELKIFLEGDDDPIIIIGDFANRDLATIFDIIFNDAPDGDESNDQFLIKVWEKLHGESKKS